MYLDNDVVKIVQNIDSVEPEEFILVLEKIKESFQSNVTKEYLSNKILKIKNTQDENEKNNYALN